MAPETEFLCRRMIEGYCFDEGVLGSDCISSTAHQRQRHILTPNHQNLTPGRHRLQPLVSRGANA
jgi:hypothetical protein